MREGRERTGLNSVLWTIVGFQACTGMYVDMFYEMFTAVAVIFFLLTCHLSVCLSIDLHALRVSLPSSTYIDTHIYWILNHLSCHLLYTMLPIPSLSV